MTTRAFDTRDARTAGILGQVVALEPGQTLTLSLIEISMAFGDGKAGLSLLNEVASDHDCYLSESDVLGVTITRLRPR
jgi:hypothetical protein